MSNVIYTATGCARCKIAKKYMEGKGIPYEELDIKGEGKEPFGQFYRSNRSAVFRGKEGIEFPVFTDGTHIRQGVGVVLAFLHAGKRLDGFIGRSDLSHGWMDGIHVSEGDPSLAGDLIDVLGYIRKNGLMLQVDTDGRNRIVLEKILEQKLADRIIMEIKAPLRLYSQALGAGVEPGEIEETIKLVAKSPEHRFQTTITPIVPEGAGKRVLTPDEVGEIANSIRECTGSNRERYLLRSAGSEPTGTTVDLFKYRSAARKYQVSTEIERPEA